MILFNFIYFKTKPKLYLFVFKHAKRKKETNRKIGWLWPYGMTLAQAKFLFKNGLKSIPQGMPVNV